MDGVEWMLRARMWGRSQSHEQVWEKHIIQNANMVRGVNRQCFDVLFLEEYQSELAYSRSTTCCTVDVLSLIRSTKASSLPTTCDSMQPDFDEAITPSGCMSGAWLHNRFDEHESTRAINLARKAWQTSWNEDWFKTWSEPVPARQHNSNSDNQSPTARQHPNSTLRLSRYGPCSLDNIFHEWPEICMQRVRHRVLSHTTTPKRLIVDRSCAFLRSSLQG